MSNTPINVLFQQAAALKTAQLAIDRTKFDSWDSWYQHALFSKQDVIDARKGDIADIKIGFARECKNQGNNHFREQRYDAAILEYERCLSVFDWIEPTDPDWKKKGIQDKLIVQKSYRGEGAVDVTETLRQIEELRLTCILNLSMCFWKLSDWAQCIRACDRALELDPSNTKALYRRAQARILPAHCGTADNLVALEDLKRAVSIKPDDALLTTAYAELKIALAEQKKKDRKTFSNLFDRAHGEGPGREGSSPAPSSVSSASSEANMIEEEMVPAPRLKGVPKLAPSAALHKSTSKAKAARKNGAAGAVASPSNSNSSYSQMPATTGSPSSSSAAKSVTKETAPGEKKALTWQDAFDMVRDMQSAAERCEREGLHQQAATIRAKKEELQKQMKIHFPKHVQNSITPELLEQEAALTAAHASDTKSKKKRGSVGSSASKLTTAAGGESPANWFDVMGPDCELVDFTNPTPGMIADARNKGLDLTDPRVQQLMQEINRVRLRHAKEEAALLPAGAKGRSADDAKQNAQRMDMYMQEALRNIHTEEAGRITATLLTDVALKTKRKMLSTRLRYYEDELHAWERYQQDEGAYQSEGVRAEPDSFFGCCSVDPWTCEAEALHTTLRSMMVVDIVALRTQIEQEAQQERAQKAGKGGATETTVGLRKRSGKLGVGTEPGQEGDGGKEDVLTDEQRALKVSEQIVDMLEMKYGTAQHSNESTAAFLPDMARMVAVVGGVACVVLICINAVIRLLHAQKNVPFDPAAEFK